MAENENTVVEAPQAEAQPDAPVAQEQVVAPSERDTRIQALESEVAGLREQLALALDRYRDSLLKASPEVPEEMVRGATVREVEEAHGRARAMVERVRSQLEAKQSRERVPPGAPPRSAPDLSGLSPREKIAQGLSRR